MLTRYARNMNIGRYGEPPAGNRQQQIDNAHEIRCKILRNTVYPSLIERCKSNGLEHCL